ncbi:MAG TPA: DNA-processing protein DprA [Tepidisphaeraceae bacterium]|nr:DNA-processing protein DprA [Tepidisphaeraceae bacterium]
MPLPHYLQLALTDGIGPILIGRLIEAQGSADKVCRISLAELREIEGIGRTKAEKIHASLRQAERAAPLELAKAQAAGVRIICPEDDAYPPLLKLIPDPPSVLYVRGDLQPRDLNALAIVGSRKCSLYGREQAERFAALLAGAGFTVTSGGARGVDSCAHRGAMQHPNGRTVAVLGCGLDVVYPPENDSLFDQIADRGAVVSEYPMGTPPVPENFPRRNRIISGMSRGVLVVEADERSGALVTCRLCVEDHNRPVFAIPGRVDNQLSAGPHKLIREGAILTTSLDHILEGLTPLPDEVSQPTLFDDAPEPTAHADAPPRIPVPTTTLTDRQQQILAAMSGPTPLDSLIDRTNLPAHEILQEMTLLTLKGQVQRVNGQTFARKSFIGS